MVKEVYNPKAVIPHAASLHQASAHCAIFPTAASRRSLGRVSVPVWPVALSGRLPVVALVGHHPTNKLIGRAPIPSRKPFPPPTMQQEVVSSISPRFRGLSQSLGQVTHVLLTRSPLEHPRRGLSARLACVKHAASVRPEPGSNSPTKNCQKETRQKNAKSKPLDEGFKKTKIGTGFHDTLLSSQKTDTHTSASGAGLVGVGRPTYKFARFPARSSTLPPWLGNRKSGSPGAAWAERELHVRGAGRQITSTPATVRLPRRSTSQRPCSRRSAPIRSSGSVTRALLT